MFMYQGERWVGQVAKMNPKRASVWCRPANGEDANATQNEKTLLVPYALLKPLSDRTDASLVESQALKRARRLMDQHNLHDWKICLDNATRRAGQCRYRTKTIGLTRLYVRKVDPAQLENTILHEIAHALVGAHHHHDAVWKSTAKKIGCTAERCHDHIFAPAQYLQKCPQGCFTPRKIQRRMRNRICRKCKLPIVYERNTDDINLST